MSSMKITSLRSKISDSCKRLREMRFELAMFFPSQIDLNKNNDLEGEYPTLAF